MKRIFLYLVLILSACSPKVQPVDPRPDWLTGQLNEPRYYTGVGHSAKDGTNNYVQAAKKSALDDLVSQIKVTVSSTSILSVFEQDRKEFREQYEQIIQTEVADEIEEFEQAGAYEDERNYWVYYRLSKERYRQIKEEQKRNAVILATDFVNKARKAEKEGSRLQAIGFYFQAFRSVEKYLGEAIPAKIDDREVLLTNEIYASIKALLDKIKLQVEPAEMVINRRLNLNAQPVMVQAVYTDTNQPAVNFPLVAAFEKGEGEVFPDYITDENGQSKILISKIASRDLEQTVGVKLNLDAISGTSGSPVYNLIASTLNAPTAKTILKVQRPVVYLTSYEKSLGILKNSSQISNRLKNLLTNAGFEFSTSSQSADLLMEVTSDSEKGSISGSIYITFLTGVIRVTEAKEGRVIYATTLDRIKGYGLDYDRSSQDAYNKAIETLEKERMTELLNTVLQ
ncbi:MAG: LPP20 family lipoprotein [Cyclobacteriaceae bacterium]|nr:MAG: LPP20 family lipoprotein [Cyclobacteriaceae bacterium]